MDTQNQNINVTISNVIQWFQESELSILDNHHHLIPLTEPINTQIVQDIIDAKYKG